MSLKINTNVPSLNAQRNLGKATKAVGDTMASLSSGSRINKAADDAAGMAISENMRASIRSLSVARRNANDGISLVQTAEGGLMETNNMLIRLRELAIQSASDTIGNQEREFLDKEYLQLKDEIDRIASSTDFNGTRVLMGNNTNGEVKSGASFPMEIQVGKDYFPDADSKSQSNPVNIIQIDFSKLASFTHGEGSLDIGQAEAGTRVNTKENAQQSIDQLDQAMGKVNEQRAYLGAIQNRLGSTLNNLGVQIENISQSKSRIVDTDYAAKTAELTRNSIIQQAGVSMLSQANSQPQVVLSLLK